jgi:transcriptional regulator with XRE-family HTH domain
VVQAELARRGWTQEEFSRRLRTTPTYLSAVLNGRRQPGISLRARMQRVLRKRFKRIFDVVVSRAG